MILYNLYVMIKEQGKGEGGLVPLTKRRRTLKKAQSGQALVEYIILLSIIVSVVAVFMNRVTGAFDVTTARYGGRIEQQLRTGSAPPTVWNR